MSQIIAVVNQKGGVGKTNIATNVAACLAMLQQRVLLIDADKQASAMTWQSLRKGPRVFTVTGMARENMAADAMDLAEGYDFTIIDGPPHAEAISRSCIAAADIVILPIEPGGPALWSSDVTVNQIRQAKTFKPTIKCGFVISRKVSGTVLGREARTIAADVGIPIFTTEIENRIAYAEAATIGKTIFEHAPKDAAVREIQTLTHELLDLFNGNKNIPERPEASAAVA